MFPFRLGGRTIINDVSLTLQANEFVALVGPNGAGKTTLIKALAGLVPACRHRGNRRPRIVVSAGP